MGKRYDYTKYNKEQVWICQDKTSKKIKSYVMSGKALQGIFASEGFTGEGSGETSQTALYCKAVNGELVQPPDFLAKAIVDKYNKVKITSFMEMY